MEKGAGGRRRAERKERRAACLPEMFVHMINAQLFRHKNAAEFLSLEVRWSNRI